MYTANDWDNGDFHQFTVNTTGYGNLSFSFCNRTDNVAVGTFIVRVSTDGGTNWTTVLNTFTPATSNGTLTTSTFPSAANNNTDVRIQIYKTSNANNARTFLIDAATLTGTAIPDVTGLSATSGCVGSAVTLTGVNFTGVTGVTINGTAVASYVVNSATSITATVASGNSTGVVAVTNANGTGSSDSSFTVFQPTVAGTISGAATVCTGTNSTTLTLSGHTGTIQWQSSPDNTTFTNIAGQTNATYTATNLTATRYYRAVVTNGTCAAATTGSVTIAVNPASVAGSISGAGSVCSGTNSTLLTLSGQTGSIQWQSSPDNTTFTNISGATNTTYTATNLTATTYYRAIVTSAPCPAATSASVAVTVNPVPTAFTATPSATSICAGQTINLTASGSPNSSVPVTVLTENFNAGTNNWTTSGTPTAAAWTLRPNGYSYSTSTTVVFNSNDNSQFYMSNSDAPGTGTTTSTILQSPAFSTVGLTTASLSFYHFYRYWDGGESGNVEVSTDGTNWNPLAVYNTTQGAGGAFANPTISLDAYLNQPTVYVRFRYAATFDYYWCIDNVTVSGVSNIIATYAWTSTPAGFTSSQQNPTNVAPTANTTYTVTVTNSYGCTTTATSAAVNVSPVSVAGTISGGGGTVCSGTNSTVLTVSGYTGTIQWQSSPNNTTFTNISGATSASFTATNLNATTYYRAVVTSTPCSSATSASVVVNVSPISVAGTISGGGGTVCSGTNSTALTLAGHTGSVQWQSSPNNTTFTNIPGATSANYTATNLSATTYYRAVVTSAPCSSATSASVVVNVSPVSVAGSISGATTVCAGTNTTALTLSGYTGTIQWQSSTNNVTFANISGATSATYTATNLSTTTYYRAVVTSSPCSAATTFASAEITVSPTSVSGTISGAATVCSGTNSTLLTLSGYMGSIQWQSSPDNTTFTNISGATGVTFTATNLTATTYYRAVVTSGVCASVNTTSVSVVVNPTSVAGTVTADQNSVCSGTNSTLLSVSGHVGSIQWQSSADDVTFTDISGATGTTYTATNLTATTFYRVRVTSGVCASVTSASEVIDVFPVSVAGTISGAGTVCAGSDLVLTVSGYTGAVQWQSSSDNVTFANISGATSATYLATNIIGTTYYRVVATSGVCPSTTSGSVMVGLGGSTTWNGSAWSNGAPTSDMTATITGSYSVAADLSACSLTVDGNAVVVIPSGYDVSLNGPLTVTSGSFTLENNANLLQTTNAANSGNIIVKRNSSAIRRQDYTLWASPVSGQGLLAFSPLTVTSPNSRFYQYNSEDNVYNSITAPGATSFTDAKGYLIRVANNHPTFPWIWSGQFNGVPHNGTYNYTLYNNGAGKRYNLVGNPYPSPISAQAFVQANSGITGTLYFWRETNGDVNNNPYCIWSPAAGGTFVTNGEDAVNDLQGIIQTGQGFFVEATASGNNVSFTNAMRVGNNANQFFRPAGASASPADAENHRIWLNVTNATGAFCQTVVGYVDGATNNYDEGLDAHTIVEATTQLYTFVDNQKLAIQCKALPFEVVDVVPMVFKATTAGTYAIAIDHVDGLFLTGQPIYIKDNVTGSQHLLNDGAYTFATDAGEFTSRFEIVYAAALGAENPSLANDVRIVKQGDSFLINSGSWMMEEVQVFDIRGRLLKAIEDINDSHVGFSVGEANQVLIVKIKSDTGGLATVKVIN